MTDCSARDVTMPSLTQLKEVFDELPDEPTGPVKKVGPQYERVSSRNNRPEASEGTYTSWTSALRRLLRLDRPTKPTVNVGQAMGRLRNGDRALVVAVNDSGNTGWVRFGRTGFSEHGVL